MTNPMQSAEYPGQSPDMPMVGMPMTHKLPRQGERPLVFQGSELAMAMSFTPGIPYWYEINIYRSTSQEYIVAIRLFYTSEEIDDIVKSWSFDDMLSAFAHIENYDAAVDLQLPIVNVEKMAPAELTCTALMLRAEVESCRAHFAGLAGELFAEVETAGVDVA